MPSLTRNIGYMASGNLIFAACQWFVLVALARLGGAEQVGEFSLALAVVAPVVVFSQVALRNVVATDQGDQHHFEVYFRTRITTTLLAVGIIFALIPFLGYGQRVNILIGLLTLAKGAEAISDIYYALGQKHERLDINARSLAIRGLASTTAFSFGCYIGGDVVYGTALYALVWVAMAFGYDRITTRPFRAGGIISAVSLGEQFEVVRAAFPLGLVLTFATVNTNIPRFVVERELGLAALGYYAAISQIIIAGLIVITAIGQSALPRLSACLQSNDRAGFTKLSFSITGLTIGLALVGIMLTYSIGEWVLKFLYGEAFSAQHDLFVYLAIAALPLYIGHIINYSATACRLFKPYALCYGLGVLVTLAAAVILVSRYGIAGAAGTIMVTGVANTATAIVVFALYFARQSPASASISK